jgi:hypothetical protein
MRSRLALVLATGVAVLGLGSAASARQGGTAAIPIAKAVVTGDDKDYMLEIQVDPGSPAPLTCWRWTLGQGALVTAASRVDGWQLFLNRPAPAPIIGGKALAGGIPPGGKQAFRILTDKPFDGNGSPGGAQVSGDCVEDGPAPIDFGSPPKPKPTPKPTPCVCKDLKTRIVANRSGVTRSDAKGFAMELLLEWNLTCSKGTGGCTGRVTPAPSARAKRLGITVAAPAAAITCTGPCAATTKRFQKLVVRGGARWAAGKRGRTDTLVRLQVKRTCKSTRIPQTFDIVFDRNGRIDTRRSDLNANGLADRKDR